MKTPNFLIGLGASAGGLEALERFFDNAPPTSGGAFIVVMHLAKDFKSMLGELLARHTAMPVHPAVDGARLQADTVYVIQPGTTLELDGSNFRVVPRPTLDQSGPATSIDLMFSSLARSWGERSGGVVLSGSGSDGAAGIMALYDHGGFTCAQAPETAKFDSMPLAAITTNAVRAVEEPEQLARTVIDGILLSRLAAEPASTTEHETALARILKAVVGVGDLDASKYKHSTFERRVQRRMMDLELKSASKYADLVASDDSEARTLADALLIGVTEFFRDTESWNLLSNLVAPELLERAQSTNLPVRIWVAGCATGEEAYTQALVFAKAMEDLPQPIDVQIFATDIKREYLTIAARGEYEAEKLAPIPAELREKYFTPVANDERMVVDPEIRKMIVFAPHDVLSDPPFTRLDMISCRNMLIYFSIDAQQKILHNFSFGLREGGFLFLGSSETVGAQRESFEFVDARNRIFRSNERRRRPLVHSDSEMASPRMPGDPSAAKGPKRSLKQRETLLQPAYTALLQDYAPDSLMISVNRELLHSFGDARRFLRPPEGVAHLDAAEMVDTAIRTPIIAGLERAVRDRTPVTFTRLRVNEFPQPGLAVDVTLKPLDTDRNRNVQFVLVIITESTTPRVTPTTTDAVVVNADALATERIDELELELDRTREALQSTIEEIETANEELQASNEELMSANEELQSTNEELSSVNEELYSVNSEYHSQNDELMRLSSDFDLLLQSTEVGVIFLDRDLNISRFTSLSGALFQLRESDVGRAIGTFRSPFDDADPEALLRRALASGRIEEQETQDHEGKAWLLRGICNPARQDSVLTVIDITRLRKAETEARQTSNMLQSLRKVSGAFYFELSENLANAERELGLSEFVGYVPSSAEPGLNLANYDPERRNRLGDHLRQTATDQPTEFVTRLWHDASADFHFVRYSAAPTGDGRWRVTGIDINDIVRSERAAREREAVLEGVLRASKSLICFVDTDEQYRYVNPAYEAQWNATRKDIIGKTMAEFLPAEIYQEAKPHIRAALQGARQDYTVESKRADGSKQTLAVVYEPVMAEGPGATGFVAYVLDVSRYYEAAAHLEHIDQLLARGVRRSTNPLLLVETSSGEVRYANAAAHMRMARKHEERDQQLTITRISPEWSTQRWVDWLSRLEPDGHDDHHDMLIFDPQGRTQSADVFVTVISDGGALLAKVRFVETTERVLAIKDLKARSRELAISNRDLEQFASIIAHDLRAPLRHINQFSELLSGAVQQGNLEEAEEFSSVIRDSNASMSGMVEGLLDYATIGSATAPFRTVDLNEVVAKVARTLATEIEANEVELDIQRLPSVHGDDGLLSRLLQNLIGNAIKYRREAEAPVIRLRALMHETRIGFVIEDNGIGIKADHAERVFKLFHRLHASDRYSGQGVGLAACRRICELHSGDIKLDTSYRNGSRFAVSLGVKSGA